MTCLEGLRLAVLRGRVHEYEGADLSEVQMPIQSLSAWGVRNIILTTSAGGVSPAVLPGQVVLAEAVVDLQHRGLDGRPPLLEATDIETRAAMSEPATLGCGGAKGFVHACVPGPQYETSAELEMLRSAGVDTVSMSPSGELRAALSEGMRSAVLVAVTNVGEVAHAEVLETAGRTRDALTEAVRVVCRAWT